MELIVAHTQPTARQLRAYYTEETDDK